MTTNFSQLIAEYKNMLATEIVAKGFNLFFKNELSLLQDYQLNNPNFDMLEFIQQKQEQFKIMQSRI